MVACFSRPYPTSRRTDQTADSHRAPAADSGWYCTENAPIEQSHAFDHIIVQTRMSDLSLTIGSIEFLPWLTPQRKTVILRGDIDSAVTWLMTGTFTPR